MNEENILLGQAEDRITQCLDRYMLTFTGFLDPHQQALLRQKMRKENPACKILFTGGYPDAQRRVMACLPDYMEGDAGEQDAMQQIFSVIRAQHSKNSSASRSGRALRHGDYLGALIGLGLKRDVIGDILVREDGADIIMLQDMAEYISDNFGKAGRTYLSVSVHPLSELLIPEQKVKMKHDTVASLRLDSLVSSAFGLARSKAADAIRGGMVLVNHEEVLKIDRMLEEGDELVLRHHGKAVLDEVGRETRKGRTAITLKIYI